MRAYYIRGKKVMLDSQIAELYKVSTQELIKAAKRHPNRFPDDFMFRLSKKEAEKLGLQHLPYVFTELGVLMLPSVLTSKRAIQISIEMMRVYPMVQELIGIDDSEPLGKNKRFDT